MPVSLCGERGIPLTNAEADTFVRDKQITAHRTSGGNMRLHFSSAGVLSGRVASSIDYGRWSIIDGSLCVYWKHWNYDGCGALLWSPDKKVIYHYYPDQTRIHLTFRIEQD
jgi:hypothetical protein